MDPEHWQQIKGIFLHVCELEPDEQTAHLDEACGGDPALREEVEALLANHRQAGSFIESSAISRPRDLTAEGSSLIGRSLGAYRILRQIGQGGMGTVYLAERHDAQYRQRVAVKLIKLGMDSEYLIARFRQERQILANLDHPQIARLLDGGTLEDGRPYLVMEYIEGEPIDRYCERQQSPIRLRLELFRKVCDAVQYAHRSLVIHRDIKPSNVLVTAAGQPKLLDFGTAKLLEPSGLESPATFAGLRLVTPDYASPEQLKAEPVTTASDVYALGVVLYKLLTGHLPYRLPSPLSPEAVRMVCEDEPPRPSTAIRSPGERIGSDTATLAIAEEGPSRQLSADEISEPRWRRRLEGDLDNIVLTAMRKEPERRYASVEQLSEDLRRYLENLPVLARPATFGYRTSKFVRRHRTGVVAAVLVLLVLNGGIVATFWQARRAVAASERAELQRQEALAQRQAAERQQARAETVSSFLVDLFEVSDPGESKGDELTAREILGRGAERIASELADQPALQATMMDTIGVVYHKLGINGEAAGLLEGALAIQRGLDGEHPEEALTLSHLSYVHQAQGNYARAEELVEEGLALRRRLFEPPHSAIAESLDDLGTCRYNLGEYQSARELHRQALDMQRAVAQTDELAIAETLNNLGAALLALDEVSDAEQRLREALEMRRGLLGEVHPDVGVTLNNLAAALYRKQDFAGAERFFEESLAMKRRLHRGADHPYVADALDNLALVRSKLKRLEEAEALHTDALEMRRRLLGQDHIDVAYSLHNLAVLNDRRGEVERAEALYRESLALFSKSQGPGYEPARRCRYNLAQLLERKGDRRAAARELRRLIELVREASGPDSPELAAAQEGLAQVLLAGGGD